ncbi:MAG: Holliday junction DNA helicase RuvA [Candidatus Ryanbacteria bacterium RIFCSPHIGHO2_02_FULL_45_17b]|uniref:Holliday junction branch migration complex subunit RuvA n=1 Tax=Candidatus Ryanbacteria bacterium RIFCSPHIGHO2_01_FULL_45_22 TaxID=1802114 RepID=A0A1G2G1Y6_9BACT|nr:MAG: Holliday junction DNA helicase RuvA [Candidatus Ryanbacteria bacterium RIFCSPHIGHO2_01_FULL_45_22]OGZ47485.1 MAG: Holliday junction DNA helicase RuvA [Candidatus Ryanbacteria bacterium RIFCSPHIGHO2_02_FULL_45_17b]
MISHLEGTIIFKGDRFAVISVGGVGYKVHLAPETLRSIASIGSAIKVWTHLHVRETDMELYGFSAYAEMQFFEVLIGISGIGPKSALGILGIAPLDTLKRAIAAGESAYLTKVSGIGKRMAEKIIVELRDKLGGATMPDSMRTELAADADVLDALIAMGYSQHEARQAVSRIPAGMPGTKERLGEALKAMGRGKS